MVINYLSADLEKFNSLFKEALSHEPASILSESIMLLVGIIISFILSIPLFRKIRFNIPIFLAIVQIVVLFYSLFLLSLSDEVDQTLSKSLFVGYTILGFITAEYSFKYISTCHRVNSLRLLEFLFSLIGLYVGFQLANKAFDENNLVIVTLCSLITFKAFHYFITFFIALLWNIQKQKKGLFPTESEVGRIYFEDYFRSLKKVTLTSSQEKINHSYEELLRRYKSGLQYVLSSKYPSGNVKKLDLLSKVEILKHESEIKWWEDKIKEEWKAKQKKIAQKRKFAQEQKRKNEICEKFEKLNNNRPAAVRKFIKINFEKDSIESLTINQKKYVLSESQQIEQLHIEIEREQKNVPIKKTTQTIFDHIKALSEEKKTSIEENKLIFHYGVSNIKKDVQKGVEKNAVDLFGNKNKDAVQLGENRKIIESHKEILVSELKKRVSNFETLNHSCGVPVKYYYFYKYYPKSETDVTENDKEIRRLIWNFKDGYDSETYKVVELVCNKLKQTFSEEERKNLTLVCAPASTVVKNIKRFKRFAQLVCSNTGVENGFNMLEIHTERESTHTSGKEVDPLNYINFHADKLGGKRVIVFDDVITRGRTICTIAKKLDGLGASSICAISIGRTTRNYTR